MSLSESPPNLVYCDSCDAFISDWRPGIGRVCADCHEAGIDCMDSEKCQGCGVRLRTTDERMHGRVCAECHEQENA